MDHKSKPENVVVQQSSRAKPAALARCDHGSGSVARSVREVDVWSSEPEPRPSRYKLELLRNAQLHSNTLLDKYEIQSIWKQLDYYIKSSHAKYHGGAPPADDKVFRKKMWFWLKHVPACSSSRDDVVERRPEKGGVPVVGGLGCRPRPPEAVRA